MLSILIKGITVESTGFSINILETAKKKRNYCLIIYITHAPGPFLLIFLMFFLNPPDTWNEKFAKTCKQLLFKKSYIHHFTIDGLPQSFKQNQIINNFIKKTQNTYTCTCIVIFYYIESRNHNITNTKITLNKKTLMSTIFFL